jgi:hypothetical protein
MQNATNTVSRLFAGIALAILVIAPVSASAHAGHDHDEEASCWISASPSHIYEGGSTTLTWGSQNAEEAWIEDIGNVGTHGSRIIYGIDENTTFELTVENDEGTASCETEVEVRTYGHSGSTKAPGCTIYRQETNGTGVVLRWNSTDASSAYLSGVGSVSTFGQYTVYPTYDTTYTLTVYGNGKSESCEIEIDRGYSTYYPNNYTNYGNQYGGYNYGYPYISLTQIPYTGLDLGVAGTAIYFLALAMFAIAGAYLLAYYQGGVLRFSFAQEVQAAARNQARSLTRLFNK